MKRIWIPQVVVSLMLLWALNPDNPYGYYMLLRWVCCAVFAFLAILAGGNDRIKWAWVLGCTAALYNPLIRVSLNREFWSVINVATVGVAIGSIFALPLFPKSGTGREADSHE